jgi:hypothetical protein
MSRLRSNKVVNQAGSGAPELTYGAVIPNTGTISGAGKVSIGGSITAASFHGDGSSLSGIDASTLKDGSNTKVQAVSTGANVTGNVAATGDITASGNVTAVDGTFSGNLTVQGTTTTIDTAVTEVDSLNVEGSVGIGTDTPETKLNVVGSTASASSSGGTLGIRQKGDTNNDGITITSSSPNSGRIWKDSSGRLHIYNTGTNNDNQFVLDNTNGGKVGINSAIPKTSFDIGSTDAVVVPVGTTGERPTPAAGMFRYNTTEGKFEGYTTEWGEIGGGGGLTTEAHIANNAVVTLDLTAAVDHKVTATGICTITCTGGTEAQSHTIRIINSGSATVGFSTYFLFPSGNTPVLTSTDGAINLISFTVNRVGAAGTQLLAGASLNFS